MDKVIKKHLLSVVDLRARNSLLPIFRLPTEILSNIFTHPARDYHDDDSPWYDNDDPSFFHVPDWVNVSYVCHHWRDVALNCPALWAYYFTTSIRWTEELLVRSKQAPLKIRIKYNSQRVGSWWADLVEMVLNHAERIQDFHMCMPEGLLPTKVPLYAPRLQTLDIFAWRSPSGRPPASVYGNVSIPLLRTLKLTGCPLLWHSLDLSKVTTLVLCNIRDSSQHTLVAFLSALGRMPVLTVLHLEDALAAVAPGAFSASLQVSLPHLTRLLVATPPSTVVALLSCIKIPLETQVRLEIPQYSPSAYTQLFALCSQRLGELDDYSTIRSVAVHPGSVCWKMFVCVSEWNDYDHHLSMDLPRECNFPFVILINVQSTSIEDRGHILGDICCAVPSTHVQTLRVNQPPPSQNFWRRTLGHFRGLQYMQLSDGYMPDLVSLLALADEELLVAPKRRITNDHDLTRDHTFVPVLEALLLRHIKFAMDDSVSQKSLLDALSTRNPLPRFSTIDCTVVKGAAHWY